MHIIFVKKRYPDVGTCGKCEEVERRLVRDWHMARIDEVIEADVSDPDSAGMRLARDLNAAYAPFFVVREGGSTQAYGIYLKFVREVLS